jgi:hypothetical protein
MRIQTALAAIAILAPCFSLADYVVKEHLRANPGPTATGMNGFVQLVAPALSSADAAEGLFDMLGSESLPRVLSLLGGQQDFMEEGDLQCIAAMLAADARTFHEQPNGYYSRKTSLVYIKSWRCNLDRAIFYRPLSLRAGGRYRISGRFLRVSGGKWQAQPDRIIRVMTRAELELARTHEIKTRAVELIPTPDEATAALRSWLRNKTVLAHEFQKCGQGIASHVTSSNLVEGLSRATSREENGRITIDGWSLFLDDLSFERSFAVSTPETPAPAVLNGFFVLSPRGGWDVVPFHLGWGCVIHEFEEQKLEFRLHKALSATPFPPPLQ